MPVGIALLVAVTAGLGGLWSWSYQRRVLDLLHRESRAKHPEKRDGRGVLAPEGPARAQAESAGTGGRGASGPVATEELERSPGSVLGWAQFSVVSVVAMGGTAIVACRSREREHGRARVGRNPRAGRPRRPWSRSRSAWPMIMTTDQTLVLLIGEDAQAERAQALLERWRRASTILWLRPTPVPGGIEFFDGHRSALRAMLLAD